MQKTDSITSSAGSALENEMTIPSQWKRIAGLTAGALLGLTVSVSAHSFSPSQAPILSSSAVKPNVLILLDNSGSMNNAIEPAEVASSRYDKVAYYNSDDREYLYADDNTILGNMSRGPNGDRCNSGRVALWAVNRLGYVSDRRCFLLPDPVGGGQTRYSAKYLSYIYHALSSTNNNNGTDLRTRLPNEYRMNVAREVTENIISQNRGLRYGLFTFNPPTWSDSGPGGSMQVEASDIQETYSPTGALITNATQALENYNSLIGSIRDVTATSNTPLAETYYEMTRYLRGMSPYQGLKPNRGNYKSPIEYRCQKNFSIVVTDGLPTFDRTFPNNDPQVPRGRSLPNWDGIDNDGNNTDGNNEGDTLYLDDIAKFAYDIDMRTSGTDLAGKSFNEPGFAKQNMQTYTVGFATSNEMLEDAAKYGHGSYYTANDSVQLNESLSQAINAISAQAGSGGAGASSSQSLTTDTVYYKTLYDPEDWKGTIEAYRLNPVTGRAGSMLWTTDTTFDSRSAGVYQTFNTATKRPVSLSLSTISAEQRAQLESSITPPLTATAEQLLNWSKGTPVGSLRSRSSLLGDIINSPLERVSPETQTVAAITGDASYDNYLSYKKTRLTNSLLVNANDGFFHVLNAQTGAHRYSYMPSSVLPLLNIVANPDYAETGMHRFLVDGQISVSDSQLGSNWATVAVAGMGAGGKSMFAVRLLQQGATNPDTPEALWEITAPATNDPASDWNDLGYTYSRAAIARTQSNQWVAIFGNGYGSYNGKAALYIVDLASGDLLRKIVVDENTSGTPAEQARGNGLSSPQIVVNAQHQLEKIYAGDLRGNLWRFDVSSTSPASWNAGKLFSAGGTKPITTYPLITEHPSGGHLVSFGTGKLAEASDKLNKDEQTFYAIWDKDGREVSNSSLLEQTINSEITISGESYFTVTTHEIDWTRHNGWRLPLMYGGVREGERVIYPAQTTEGRVIFVTAKIDAADPCVSSGSGRLVELDLLSGSMLNYEVLDTNADGKIDESDTIVAGLNFNDGMPGAPVIIDRGPEKPTQTKAILLSTGETRFVDEKARSTTNARRIMWRQIQ